MTVPVSTGPGIVPKENQRNDVTTTA